MAVVPTTAAPSVLPTTNAGSDYQQVNATPAAFGAQIGAAGSQLGGEIGKVGAEAAQTAIMQQGIVNESLATDGSAAFSKAQGALDAKYYSLQGKQAVDAFPQYQKDLGDLRDNTLAGMPNPTARNMLAQDVSRRVGMAYEGASRFNAQQIKAWSVDSSMGRAATSVNAAVGVRNDNGAAEDQIQAGQSEIQKAAEVKGLDPDTIKAQIATYRGQAYGKVIDTLALENPFAAQTMFNNVRSSLDAGSQLSIAERLKPAVAKATTDSQFNMLTNQGMTPGSTDVDTLWNAQKVQESGNKQFVPGTNNPVTSPKGALGISQIMPATAAQVETDLGLPHDPARVSSDPAYNEMLGKHYMQQQLTNYRDPNVALAAYNAGPGAVDNALKLGDPRDPNSGTSMQQFLSRLPAETQNYVKTIGAHTSLQAGASTPVPALNNFSDLVSKAIDMTKGDPEAQERLLGRLGQWKSAQETMVSQQRATLGREVDNLGPALLNGQDGLVIPEQKIRSMYPADKADAILADLNLKQTAGQVFKNVALASPEDLQEYQRQLVTGQGLLPQLLRGKMNIPVDATGSPVDQDGQLTDMKARTQVAGMLQTMIAKRDTAIKADPASYAITNDPGVAAAYKDMQANGDAKSFSTYAQAVTATQQHLGVLPHQTAILPIAQVQNVVRSLMSSDPAKTDIGARVDGLEKQFGDSWPQVFGQLVTQGKLPRDWQAVATMNAPEQAAARSDLVRAIQGTAQRGGAAEFNKLIPKQDMEAITTGLRPGSGNALDQFMQTASVPGAPTNTLQQQGDVRESVELLAKYYVTQHMDGATAVQKAADGVLGQRYDFDGTMRTPKGMMAQTQTMTRGIESNLSQPGALADPGYTLGKTGGDLTPEQRTGIIAGAKKTWIPNENDDGLVMLAQMKDGTQVPVMRSSDGRSPPRRVEMHFSDLAGALGGVSVAGTTSPAPAVAPAKPSVPSTPSPDTGPLPVEQMPALEASNAPLVPTRKRPSRGY